MTDNADTARVCPGSKSVNFKRSDGHIRCPYCKELFKRPFENRNVVPTHPALIDGPGGAQ